MVTILIYLALDGPLFNKKKKKKNYSCQAKKLLGVHANREHSNLPVNQAGRRIINKTGLPGVRMFASCFFFCFIAAFNYYRTVIIILITRQL